MTVSPPQTIVLFGGSFNPIHCAHVAMIEWAAAQCAEARIVVVPCWTHPFAKPLAAYADRVAMCRAALADRSNTTVSTIEEELGGVSYTARTVRALQARHPGVPLQLLLGADVALELPTWRDAAWLQQHVATLIVPRGPDSPVPNISSSTIRDRLRHGTSLDDLVPPAVAAYITTHGLYQDTTDAE